MDIEDTIFDAHMPSNPIPVVDRLLELIKESDSNDPQVLLQDERVQRVLYLLTHQFTIKPTIILDQRVLDKYEWYRQMVNRWHLQENSLSSKPQPANNDL